MQEYAFRVKLTATVRVRAADEIVARRAATSVLLSLQRFQAGPERGPNQDLLLR
jgi:hypothetical protein